MAESRIWLASPTMHGEEMKYIQEAFDTNWVVPMGPNVNAFEQDLANMANSKSDGSEPLDRKVVCLSAGTAAVHLALIACGVQAGDEVLVQSFRVLSHRVLQNIIKLFQIMMVVRKLFNV